MNVLQPPGWPRPRGFSNGIVAEGRSVFVAGQVGTVPETQEMAAGGFGAQLRQALAHTLTILAQAGAGPEHTAEMSSEEPRVGKEWGSTCRSRWSPDH